MLKTGEVLRLRYGGVGLGVMERRWRGGRGGRRGESCGGENGSGGGGLEDEEGGSLEGSREERGG